MPTDAQSFLLPLLGPGYHISGKEVEVRDSGSWHHQLCRRHNLQLIKSRVAPSHGPLARVLSPLSSRQSFSCCLSHVAKGSTPEPRGPNLLRQSSSGSDLVWLPQLGFNSHTNLPLQPHFHSSHNQHSHILPALLGCHNKSRQPWPHGMSQSSPSSHASAVTSGSCFPVTSWVEVTPIPLPQSMATAI